MFWVIAFVVHFVTHKTGNIKFSSYLLLIYIIRNLIPFFDLENNRDQMNNVEVYIHLFSNMAFISV